MLLSQLSVRLGDIFCCERGRVFFMIPSPRHWRANAPLIHFRIGVPHVRSAARSSSTSARLPRPAHSRQDSHSPHQARRDRAGSGPGLQPWRRRAGARNRRQPGRCLPLHRQGQPGGRHLQRHRHPGAGQSGAAGLQAGDGGQGPAVQALRRHRRHRHRGEARDQPAVHRHCRRHRRHLRRHQPGRHQGSRVLRDRAGADRALRHSGVPR